MNRHTIYFFLFALFATSISADAQSSDNPASLVVKLTPAYAHISQPELERLCGAAFAEMRVPFSASAIKTSAAISAQGRDGIRELQRYRVIIFSDGSGAEEYIARLQAQGVVEYADVNGRRILPGKSFTTPAQPATSSKRASVQADETGFWWLDNIQAATAWDKATGEGVIIGVIDTGLDFLHPDLVEQLYINPAEDINGNGTFEPWPDTLLIDNVPGDLNGLDEDGNGYPDDIIGYDFVDQSLANLGDWQHHDPIPFDEQGHGTNVCGVIAGARNDLGATGLAYNSKILALRAFDATGNGEDDDVAAAIVYGALAGADVLNFSFGDVFLPPIVRDAVQFAYDMGCVIVSSSGNTGGKRRHFPSNLERIMEIGAVTRDDVLPLFSSFGSQLDMVAPGVEILTTGIDSTYEEVSGTSFSAPLVAATAGLILELHPQYTPDEVRGVLQTTADDIGRSGWDDNFGAGRLNAAQAVSAIGASDTRIVFPRVDDVFDRRKQSEIPVIGSAYTPFLESFTIELGVGESPRNWNEIAAARTEGVLEDTLAKISTSDLIDTTYTLRLHVQLADGGSLETRIRFDAVSTPPEFTAFDTTAAWFGDRRVVTVAARVDRRTLFSVRFRPKNSDEEFIELTEYDRFTQNHEIVIGAEARAGIEYEAMAYAFVPGGDTATQTFDFTRSAAAIPRSGFALKARPHSLPFSYLLNDVAVLYGPGSTAIVVNELSGSGGFGPTKTYEFVDKGFEVRDSIAEVWLPRAMGDSNGDGREEIFAQSVGRSMLFQAASEDGSAFSELLFSETQSGNFWASAMVDFTGDGNEELIARSDTAFMAYQYSGAGYEFLALARNTTVPDIFDGRNRFTVPISASGDFDGDGAIELAYGDEDSDFLVFEFENGVFSREFSDLNDDVGGSSFVAAVDIEEDGVPELLIGYHSRLETNLDREYDEQLWTFKLFKGAGANAYEQIWQEHFSGVRPINPFRSGVTAGNVDGRQGQEFIISIFPNLYIFTFNAQNEAIEPLWNHPASLSNTALVHDFDDNGIAEIGFNIPSGLTYETRFFEFASGPEQPRPPSGFDALALNESTVRLTWNPVAEATEYRVFFLYEDPEDPQILQPVFVGSTSDTEFEIDTLRNETLYECIIATFNPDFENPLSDASELRSAFTHTPLQPISVSSLTNRTLAVRFSGRTPNSAVQPSKFAIAGIGAPSSAIPRGSDEILLEFAIPLPDGATTLTAHSFPDFYGTPTLEGTLEFIHTSRRPAVELYLASLDVISDIALELHFSEPVELNSATVPESYEIQPFVGVDAVESGGSDGASVIIRLDPRQPLGALGKSYTLTARNVRALSGNGITDGAGATLGFLLTADDLEEPFVFPNPVRLSETSVISFGNLTREAEIIVRDIEGQIITTLVESDGNGGLEWDGRDQKGRLIGSGVYLYTVTGRNRNGVAQESPIRKFAVIR